MDRSDTDIGILIDSWHEERHSGQIDIYSVGELRFINTSSINLHKLAVRRFTIRKDRLLKKWDTKDATRNVGCLLLTLLAAESVCELLQHV